MSYWDSYDDGFIILVYLLLPFLGHGWYRECAFGITTLQKSNEYNSCTLLYVYSMHACTHAHTYTHTYTHAHIHTHTQGYTNTHTYAYTRTHMCVRAHTHSISVKTEGRWGCLSSIPVTWYGCTDLIIIWYTYLLSVCCIITPWNYLL